MRGRPNRDKPPPLRLLPPCTVCCQRAAGFHYGVTTCDACKGFFRRSLLRIEPYKCMRTKECRIGADTPRRQMCPKCRYDKCISVGMSKDAIKTGRYSLLKKSKDIHELLQHQQASADGSLNEELRMKAKQTLDKINRTKRREWTKFCGDLTLSVYVNSSTSESHPRSTSLQDLSAKEPEKTTNIFPRNESTYEVNRDTRTSFQHEPFSNQRFNPTCTSSTNDINHVETIKKRILPGDCSRQYGDSFPPPPCHGRNQTSLATSYHNWNANSSGYPHSPITSQCVDRLTNYHPNKVDVDHSHSVSHISDGTFAKWSENHCIYSKECLGTERVSIGSLQNINHCNSSHCSLFNEIKQMRSSPSSALSCWHKQNEKLYSLQTPQEKDSFSVKGNDFLYLVSDPNKVCLPTQTEKISPCLPSLWSRFQHGTTEVPKENLPDVQNCDYYSTRFLNKGETEPENTTTPEALFEKCSPQSIVEMETRGVYDCYTDKYKNCNDVGIDQIGKGSNDRSFTRDFVISDVHHGYDAIGSEKERDNQSGLKSRDRCLEDNSSNNYNDEHHHKINTKDITTLSPEKRGDIEFSIFDIPVSIAGTDVFDLSFIETFPYASYEKNVLKSILHNYSDSVTLEKDAVSNRESIKSTIRSMWQNRMSDTIKTSMPAQNSLKQWNENHPYLTLSNTSAFTAENLHGFNLSDYSTAELENVISGLIKSHEATIGLDSNCLSDRQIETAHNVFQSLCRLKQHLLGPFQSANVLNSCQPSKTDLDGRREMFCVYSLRSNENLPKVLTFYRSIPGFKHLSSKDKVTLVRGAISEFMFLGSFNGLDHKRMTLVDATNLLTIDMSTLVFAFPLFEELFATMHVISQELKRLELSKDILIVLKAISLMTPDRPCLEKPEQVKEIYKRLHACLKLLLDKQHNESGDVVYNKIGALFHTMQLSVGKFMLQRDDNLKKVLEDTPVPLLKETLFHFLFE